MIYTGISTRLGESDIMYNKKVLWMFLNKLLRARTVHGQIVWVILILSTFIFVKNTNTTPKQTSTHCGILALVMTTSPSFRKNSGKFSFKRRTRSVPRLSLLQGTVLVLLKFIPVPFWSESFWCLQIIESNFSK